MSKHLLALVVAVVLTGCTVTVAPVPTPEPTPDGPHPVYNVMTSCLPLSYGEELDHSLVGVYDGVIDGDPWFFDYYQSWAAHINITDENGQQCRIMLLSQSGFGDSVDGSEINFVGGYYGMGSGRTDEGVSYPLHIFFLPGNP